MLKSAFISSILTPKAVISFIVGGILVTGLGAAVILQTAPQIADLRNNACLSCGGGTCPDGFSYGPDSCAPQASCQQRSEEACRNHGGGTGTGGAPTSGSSGAPANASMCDSSSQTASQCRGQAVGTRIGGTCTCRRTTGTLCGCMAEGVSCASRGGGCVNSEGGKSCNQLGYGGSPGGECTGGKICCGSVLPGTGGNETPTSGNKIATPQQQAERANKENPLARSPSPTPLKIGQTTSTSCTPGQRYCRNGNIMLCTNSSGSYTLQTTCSEGCSINPVACKVKVFDKTSCIEAGRQASASDFCCVGSVKCAISASAWVCRSGTAQTACGGGTVIKAADGRCSTSTQGDDGCDSGTSYAVPGLECSTGYKCGKPPTVTNQEESSTKISLETTESKAASTCNGMCRATACATTETQIAGTCPVKGSVCCQKNQIIPLPKITCYGQAPKCDFQIVQQSTCPTGYSTTRPKLCVIATLQLKPTPTSFPSPTPTSAPKVSKDSLSKLSVCVTQCMSGGTSFDACNENCNRDRVASDGDALIANLNQNANPSGLCSGNTSQISCIANGCDYLNGSCIPKVQITCAQLTSQSACALNGCSWAGGICLGQPSSSLEVNANANLPICGSAQALDQRGTLAIPGPCRPIDAEMQNCLEQARSGYVNNSCDASLTEARTAGLIERDELEFARTISLGESRIVLNDDMFGEPLGETISGVVGVIGNLPLIGIDRWVQTRNIAINSDRSTPENNNNANIAALALITGFSDATVQSNRLFYQIGMTPEEAEAYRRDVNQRIPDAIAVGTYATTTANGLIGAGQAGRQLSSAVDDLTTGLYVRGGQTASEITYRATNNGLVSGLLDDAAAIGRINVGSVNVGPVRVGGFNVGSAATRGSGVALGAAAAYGSASTAYQSGVPLTYQSEVANVVDEVLGGVQLLAPGTSQQADSLLQVQRGLAQTSDVIQAYEDISDQNTILHTVQYFFSPEELLYGVIAQ